MEWDPALLAPNDRVLSTLEKDGSRRWLFPKLAHGRFLNRRKIVGWSLIAIFNLIPYITINHKPAVLLDLAKRRFTLFGYTFLPTDTILLALLLVSCILSVFFVTALLGRVWCGWGCPQTVYMEFLFRPIERLFLGRSGTGGVPKKDLPGWRKPVMYLVYLILCAHLANTFLSYFVGAEQLRHWIFSPPWVHPAGFAIVVFVTLAMLFNFAYFREQTCIIACPYGRLQSALLDRHSLIISYDKNRGEPRAPLTRQAATAGREGATSGPRSVSLLMADRPPATGDCIDCTLCVQVCPTGIDIRGGLQVECVGCAQCADACDTVMTKIGKPIGLVRYSSQAVMDGQQTRVIRPRVVIYSVILIGILSLLSALILTKAPADVTVLRSLGQPFITNAEGLIENTLRVKLTNRSEHPQTFTFAAPEIPELSVHPIDSSITLAPGEMRTEPLHLIASRQFFASRLGRVETRLVVTVNGTTNLSRTCELLGPMNLEAKP